MAAHAYATVPYYRETMRRLGLRPHDLRTAADLARLPIIEREDVQRDPVYYVSSAQPLGRYLSVRSGGSTGEPRTIFHDARSVVESGAYAERQRAIVRRLVGRQLHYREAIIESPFGTTRASHEFLASHLLISPRLAFNRLYLSLLDSPEQNFERLKAFRPHVVEGYGSYLELLLPYIHASRGPLDWPNVVLYGSDAMSPAVRRLITDTMGRAVLSVYGAVESFQIGFECEYGLGYHLNVDLAPLRIVRPSGEEQAPGEVGEVTVSNLINRGTVLLNYRLGDLASIQPVDCPCGRSLPLLSFIEGRADDWIQSASGDTLHPQAVRTLFTDEDGIYQYQVVQLAPGEFEAHVVAESGVDRSEMRARLAEKFVARAGPGTRIRVSFADAVKRTEGGKVRVVTRAPIARAPQSHTLPER